MSQKVQEEQDDDQEFKDAEGSGNEDQEENEDNKVNGNQHEEEDDDEEEEEEKPKKEVAKDAKGKAMLAAEKKKKLLAKLKRKNAAAAAIANKAKALMTAGKAKKLSKETEGRRKGSVEKAIAKTEEETKVKRKHKSGAVAMRLIKKYQASEKPVMQQSPLHNYHRHELRAAHERRKEEGFEDPDSSVMIEKAALTMLGDAVEMLMIMRFRGAGVLAKSSRARTVTIHNLVDADNVRKHFQYTG
jgi:hypothetical protein